MAPVGMVGALGWLSSPELGIISLITFLILSATLLALCARCQRNSGNTYDVSGTTTTDGAGGANGTADTKTGGTADADTVAYSNWRTHTLPASTLERPNASTD